MRQVNLRLQGLLFSFSLALLSSVCLGYYAMSQSNFRALQAKEIQAEREKSEKLLHEINILEALDQFETVVEVKALPPVTVQWSSLPIKAQYRTLSPIELELLSEPQIAPSFEDLAAQQASELNSRLGLFTYLDSSLYQYR